MVPVIVLALVLTAFIPAFTMNSSDDSFGAVDGSSDYYYTQLDADEKVIYNKVKEKALTIDPSTEEGRKVLFEASEFSEDTLPSLDEVRKSFYCFLYDHPEIFWIKSRFTYPESPGIGYIILNCTADTNEALTTQKNKVNAGISAVTVNGEFTYDKVKQIHDWIVSNCRYDTEALRKERMDIEVPEAHSIYGIFVNKTAVCEGYAKAFMYLCQKNGIPVIVSVGDGNSSSGSESHMWNYIQMEDGVWYCMDVTWDDPLVNGADSGDIYYNYFLKGKDSVHEGMKFTESHVDKTKERYGVNIPPLSADPYRFQPGETESLVEELGVKDGDGKYSDSYKLIAADIDALREKIGTEGSVKICTSDFQFKLSCADLKTVKEKLSAAGIDDVTFGGAKEKKEVKVLAQYGFLSSVDFLYGMTKEVEVYTPTVSTGDISSLGLESIEIGIPVEMANADLPFFVSAWDMSDPESPQKIDAKYLDGVEYITVSSLGSYCVSNNPLTPGTGLPFIYIIVIVVLAIFILLFLIRALLRHRKISKTAKLMSRSSKNMQHYKQLYDAGELTRTQEKAYRKAEKRYAKEKKGSKKK